MKSSRCAVVSFACFVFACSLPAQTKDPAELISEAETFLKAGAVEDAVAAAWRAVTRLERSAMDGGKATSALLSAAKKLLAEHEPLHKQRLELQQEVATDLLGLAIQYARKRYYATAMSLCETAERYDPSSVAAKRRAAYAKSLARRGRGRNAKSAEPEEEAPKEQPIDPARNRIPEMARITHSQIKRVGDSIVMAPIGPAGSRWSMAEVDMTLLHSERARIELDIAFTSDAGCTSAGLIFGARSLDEYHFIAIEGGADSKEVSVCLYRFQRSQPGSLGKPLEPLARAWIPRPATGKTLTLEVVVEGSVVRYSCKGWMMEEKFEAAAPLLGGLGFYVHSAKRAVRGIEFQALRVMPPASDEEPDEPERAVEAEWAGRVDAAIAKLDEEDVDLESLARELRGMLSQVESLPAGAVRDTLVGLLEEAWGKADPCFSKYSSLARRTAQRWISLGDQHRGAGRFTLADQLYKRAATWHAKPASARRTELAIRLARRAGASDEARAEAFVIAFSRGGGPEYRGWEFSDAGVRGPLLTSRLSWLDAQMPHLASGRAYVEFAFGEEDGADGGRGAGLALAFGGSGPVLALLERDRTHRQVRVVLTRFDAKEDRWDTFSRLVLPFSEKVRWYGVEMSWKPDEVLVRVGQHPPLRWTPTTPLNGRLALYAGGGSKPGRVLFRGLQVESGPAAETGDGEAGR